MYMGCGILRCVNTSPGATMISLLSLQSETNIQAPFFYTKGSLSGYFDSKPTQNNPQQAGGMNKILNVIEEII